MADLPTRHRLFGPRSLLFFAVGVGLFLVAGAAWGEEGIRIIRWVFVVVFATALVAALVMLVAGFRSGSGRIARLLRRGRVEEACRLGRELVRRDPGDVRVLWLTTAALLGAGAVEEARSIFARIRPESLPPRMAAHYGEVRDALHPPNGA